MTLGERRSEEGLRAGEDSWEPLRQAVIDEVLERGYEGLEVDRVLAKAELSRSQFDRLFAGKEECCLRVYEANMADFDSFVFGAFESEDSWRDGLRASAYGAARYLREHPREVVFGEIAMREGGEMAQALRDRYLQRIVDLIDQGRADMDDPEALGRGVAEGVCGAIYSFLIHELQKDAAGIRTPEEFVPDLMYIAVRPYLGHAAAQEELDG